MEESLIEALAGFLVVIGVIAAVIFLVYYIFSSIGLYRMAVKSNLNNPWLAWIPLGNVYIMGSVAGEISFFGAKITHLGIIYLIVSLALGIASQILGPVLPIVGYVLNIALLIFTIPVLHKMFKHFVDDNATLYTVLTILPIPFTLPICFMKAGNRSRIDDKPTGGPISDNGIRTGM